MVAVPRRKIWILVVLGFAVLGLWLAQVRPVDGDEGYYASAARLVAEGNTPYADFFYPQAPLLPYAYALPQMAAGSSLGALRIFSVLCAALGLWCLGSYFSSRHGGEPALAALGVLLVAADPHFLTWNVVIKTYALTNLGVLAVLWLLHRGWTDSSRRYLLLAGMVAGLVAGVRLFYLAWAGALWLAILITQARRRDRLLRILGSWTAGLALGLAPMLFFFLADPDRFLFNNLRYHALRFSVHKAAGAGWGVRLADALGVLGGTLARDPYLILLLGLAAWGLYSRRRDRDPGAMLMRIWAAGVLALVLVCLLPDPVYAQYFTATWSPLFAPLSLAGLADLLRRASLRGLVMGAVPVGLGIYAAVMLGVAHTGMDMDPVWSMRRQPEVARAIRERSQPQDMVLAFWSGYPFLANRVWAPGMENHFALGVSSVLTPRQRQRYHIVGKDLLAELFRARTPAVVVLGGWMHEINSRIGQQELVDLLADLKRNYRLDLQIGEVSVMVPKQDPDR